MNECDGWGKFNLDCQKDGAMDQTEALNTMELSAPEIIPAVK